MKSIIKVLFFIGVFLFTSNAYSQTMFMIEVLVDGTKIEQEEGIYGGIDPSIPSQDVSWTMTHDPSGKFITQDECEDWNLVGLSNGQFLFVINLSNLERLVGAIKLNETLTLSVMVTTPGHGLLGYSGTRTFVFDNTGLQEFYGSDGINLNSSDL